MNKNRTLFVLAGAAGIVLILLCILWAVRPAPAAEEPEPEAETVRILTIGETSEQALGRVSSALSEITLKRLGCRVELRMIRPEEYDERIDDLLLESDFADIFVCRNRTTMNKLLDGNYIYRLDRYLESYPEFWQAVPDENAWLQTEVNGYTYGIPFGNDNGYRWGFIMRQDICEELDIDPAAITTLDELYRVLLRVRAAYPDLIPVVSDRGEMETFASGDLLVSGGGCLITEDGVVSVCQLPEFWERCAVMRRWYDEELIFSGAPLSTDGCDAWMASGMAFGVFSQMGRYTVRELEYSLGAAVECAALEDTFFGDGVSDMSFAVYAYTEDVDLSLQVLRLIYTDPDILRMCIYGQENIDYTLSPSGAAAPASGIGREERYINWCWALRDQAPPPFTVEDPDWHTGQGTGTKDVFFFDNRAVSNEIYQCSQVLEKYFEVLCAGMIDGTEGIAMMEEELMAANMETVRAELERQRNAWLSARLE